jgi:6-phosphogluconolactonase
VSLAIEVLPDAEGAALRFAALVAERARESVEARGAFTLALSRDSRGTMLHALWDEEVPWELVTIFQVDERVAPPGHPERNLVQLLAELPGEARPDIRPMPVDDPDLDRAAARYADELPDALDLVHLGLGPDGHTASLLPGDPVLEVTDRLVAITGEYQGWQRMTLTYPALAAAREIVWLVTGESKRDALGKLLAGDESIPGARIANESQLVVADEAAAGGRPDATDA